MAKRAAKGVEVDVSVYRRLALTMPGAVEGAHMGAPDFRTGEAGRIFATLAYGQKGLGTLMLSAEQQAMFLAEAPEYFSAAAGAWGRAGAGGCAGECAGWGVVYGLSTRGGEAGGEEAGGGEEESVTATIKLDWMDDADEFV